MHNHYHLLLETPEGDLSRGIRQLNSTYAQYFNKKYLLELSRYIVLNPLRDNLVEDPMGFVFEGRIK